MKQTVVITDSLFVFDEHERALREAGFDIRRIDKPKASDDELIGALAQADGYILGGIERLTPNILANAKKLRAIAFTGSGYKEFIPAYKEATDRGIAIAAARGGNTNAVAEYTIALVLTALRNLPDLISPGEVKFKTTRSAEDTIIGIIGLGSIGSRVAQLCVCLGFKKVMATPRDIKNAVPIPGVELVTKEELVKNCDIVSLHVSAGNGMNAFDRNSVESLKKGSVVINAAFPEAVDQEALLSRLRSEELSAAFDAPIHGDTTGIPRSRLIQSNMQTAFNTAASNQRISDWVTRAMIALLSDKDDPLIVNPEFRQHKR